MSFVISLGGSVIGFPPRKKLIEEVANLLDNFFENGERIAVVVGGGPVARKMMEVVENPGMKDIIGIQATRLNALLFYSFLKHGILAGADFLKAKEAMRWGIPVLHGTVPGVTTDHTAAALAELTGSVFVNVTTAGGILKDGKIVRKISVGELLGMIPGTPGQHFPMDIAALNIVRRSKIKCFIVGVDDLKDVLRGEARGTEVMPEG